MAVLLRILGAVLVAMSIWYILLLYKNNRNRF